ncbi:MAG: hypothetical protein IPP93_11650 [Chitinophagaceae bacterium]|nr:hypothetical protein [Chitinophagaceae bacterium]
MTSSKQVTGIINFANFGYIQLGAFDLTVNGSLTGGNTIAHVISDGIGFLKITAIGAGPVVFPIGADVATYNPVTVRSGGGADYSARVEVGLNPAIFNNNFAILRTWNLKSSATVAGVDIDLEYNGSQGGPSFNYAGFVEVGAFIGVSWNIIATGLTPTGTYLVNVNPVNVS